MLNYITDRMDLTDVCNKSPPHPPTPSAAEYKFFLSAHGTFSRINYDWPQENVSKMFLMKSYYCLLWPQWNNTRNKLEELEKLSKQYALWWDINRSMKKFKRKFRLFFKQLDLEWKHKMSKLWHTHTAQPTNSRHQDPGGNLKGKSTYIKNILN